MSSPLAIAAVTATLRNVLHSGLNDDVSGTAVTTRPLDLARADVDSDSQVNLFLYHLLPNAAWRNQNVPWRTRPGENGHAPLALDLYYLLTAFYGQNEDSMDGTTDPTRLLGSHRLLGRAMGLLHDHMLLDTEAVNLNLPALDRTEEPYTQVESVRITPQPLSLDEMSKLWSSFQTEYRPSAAYAVSVVLIESARPRRAALPVLRRGSDDRGAYVFPIRSPFLNEVVLPQGRPAALLGDEMLLRGTNLDRAGLRARFEHERLEEPLERSLPASTNPAVLAVELPDPAGDASVVSAWPAGVYLLSLIVEEPDVPAWRSNAVPFALAPQLESRSPATAPAGDVTLTLTCVPQVRDEQRVVLLFGEREVAPEGVTTPADPTAATTLTFLVEAATPGTYVLRLRIDGVDSMPVDFAAVPPAFDAGQMVTIT